jgi:hypothetical protein
MKKINHISYKLLLLFVLIPVFAFAQSKRESIESFDVDKKPEIKLNVSHAQIIVSTWNKNRVEVKTTLQSETLNQTELDEIFEANQVKVLGNSKRVEISSAKSQEPRMKGMVIRKTPTPPQPPTPPSSGRVKGAPSTLKRKASTNAEGVPSPPSPPTPPMQFNFDYEAFKEEGKAYIEKFKQQFDSTNFREEMQEFREVMLEWRNDLLSERKDLLKGRVNGDSTFVFVKRFQSSPGDSFYYSFKTIKKIIEIKVPKSASFEVDLKHSSLDAESMENLTADLKYSDLRIKSISGKTSEIKMNYSNLRVDRADQLKLDLVYSKEVNLGEVNDLKVKSKMSELNIGNLKNQAFIQGSYGELSINEIHPKFSLIDIQLEKSSANLKLPEDSNFNFYAKSSNSKFNMNSDLDFKMTKSFDDVIYTNSSSQSDTQRFSLNVDYSTITLN